MAQAESDHPVPFRQALRFWAKLGFISFGGPAGQIATMQHELVDRQGWIDQGAFLRGLNFCMLLPGPEAQQLATYLGWRLHGLKGGLAAGILFILPGAFLLYALAWIAAAYGDVAPVAAVFDGLKPVVVAIVAQAVWRIGKRTLVGWPALILATLAFLAVQFEGAPFPAVVLAAAVTGWISTRTIPGAFATGHTTAASLSGGSDAAAPPLARLGIVALSYAVLLAVPVGAVIALVGPAPFLTIARFFTQAAFVTFGGAYAVLPYIANAAVDQFHWLNSEQMINGLALAETTPGPLILVLQYVGFFAGWNGADAAGLSPIGAATIGAALASYAAFLPSTCLILAGAPYIERIARIKAAAGALAAITAAVVGVVLTLAVFLARNVVFDKAGKIDGIAVAAIVIAFGVLVRFRVSLHWLVAGGALFGLARAAFDGALF